MIILFQLVLIGILLWIILNPFLESTSGNSHPFFDILQIPIIQYSIEAAKRTHTTITAMWNDLGFTNHPLISFLILIKDVILITVLSLGYTFLLLKLETLLFGSIFLALIVIAIPTAIILLWASHYVDVKNENTTPYLR